MALYNFGCITNVENPKIWYRENVDELAETGGGAVDLKGDWREEWSMQRHKIIEVA